MSNMKEQDAQYIAHTYARFQVEFTHGSGAILYDEKENPYIDMTAGIGVNALGHANGDWTKAVCEQASQLAHVSNLYYSKPCVEVAKTLCEMTGFSRLFFANSGAEANEGAIKVARKYAHDHYGEQRSEIITLVNSFHGRTVTTLTATGQAHFHQHFGPFTPGFSYVNANDIEELKQKVSSRTCAIMMELIQGEGGVLPLDQTYVKQVAALCKEHDILLIIDEVQTGIGRTGTLYAYQQYEIQPDLVTSAKGLGNGLPIGAVLLHDKVKDVLNPGDHGTTFGGNPVACAGAQVVLSYMTSKFLEEVKEKGHEIEQRVMKMPHVKQVNGLGLMRGVVLDDEVCALEVVKACMKKGVLFLTAKDKLRMLPPLVITQTQLQQAMDVLEDVLTNGI